MNGVRVNHQWRALLRGLAAQALHKNQARNCLLVLQPRGNGNADEVPEDADLRDNFRVKGSHEKIQTRVVLRRDLIAGRSQHFEDPAHAVGQRVLKLRVQVLLRVLLILL